MGCSLMLIQDKAKTDSGAQDRFSKPELYVHLLFYSLKRKWPQISLKATDQNYFNIFLSDVSSNVAQKSHCFPKSKFTQSEDPHRPGYADPRSQNKIITPRQLAEKLVWLLNFEEIFTPGETFFYKPYTSFGFLEILAVNEWYPEIWRPAVSLHQPVNLLFTCKFGETHVSNDFKAIQ